MNNQISNEFQALLQWVMNRTQNEMSLEAAFNYDIYDPKTNWRISIFRPQSESHADAVCFQLIDEKNNTGTQVKFVINNGVFCILSVYYWEAGENTWKEDHTPFTSTHEIWNKLKNI